MNHISSAFKKNRKALIAYIPIGYPDVEATLEAATLLAECGCDVIELGIPFSDPLADGVTIQNATHRSLLGGINVRKCLDAAYRINSRIDIPMAFMGYLNPVLHYGIEKFCTDCADAGVSGLIIPDLPPGEMIELDKSAKEHSLDIIYFLAPNSPESRIKLVAHQSHGFIYVVSVTGVTGVRDSVSTGLDGLIKNARELTDLPLCIGFGISNPDQARKAAGIADGVIIGSRIIQLMENGSPYQELRKFITEVRKAIDEI